MSIQVRRTWAATLAVAMALALLWLPGIGSASHESTTIDVGLDNTGNAGRNNYDDSDITVNTGTDITFEFVDGFHNVVWTSANPAGLANSPAAPGGDAVGTSYTVTPTVAGEYIYFCSIHTNAATALAASDFGADRPAEMYGRITVVADTTAPTWGAGSATATPISASQIDLAYPTATDDSGSVSYEIYQASGATQPAKPGTPVATVATTTYSAVGLSAGVHYWFWITPVDGAGNAAPDLTADATTSSVAASDSATSVLTFDVNATLSISVTPTLDLGNLDPVAPGAGQTTATVQSNNSWTLSVKSIGANGVDDAPGDDGVFTSTGGSTIPVARASWDAGSGASALSDVDAVVVTGMPATAGTDVPVDWTVALEFDDPAGTNYQTTVLYTVTQP